MSINIERYVTPFIKKDLTRKMVFLSGARQTGKTTLGKMLLGKNNINRYLNWDSTEDRENILKNKIPSGIGLIIFDEIHKYRQWRQMIKGLFDTRKEEIQILVTGSAKLDYYRYGGDSLQGRYHFYRLHPFSVAELKINTLKKMLELLEFGGFPEPYLLKDKTETKRWGREFRTRIIKEDLRDLEHVTELGLMEKLSLRLPELVGSPLSINSLREDLQVSHKTIARWLEILEKLYFIFRVYPFGAPRIRAVKKEAKHYHTDWTQVAEESFRFENFIACHLLKWCNFLEDTEGRNMELRFFRDIDRREVDFVLMEDNKPVEFIECKLKDKESGTGLKYLHERFAKVSAVQISLYSEDDYTDKNGIRHCTAVTYLNRFV